MIGTVNGKTSAHRRVSQSGSTSPDDLLALYEITPEDLQSIRAFGRLIAPRLGEYVEGFYSWLRTQPEFAEYFSDAHRLGQVQQLQREYWNDFFQAQIDSDYLDRRRVVGEVHARIGLPLPTYFAAMNLSLKLLTETMYDGSLSHMDYAKTVRAVTKLLHLDTAIVVETFSAHTNRVIADQSQTLLEMSTPVTALWDGILMLPVVGIIDSKRAQDIMHAMLSMIRETKAKVFILDISGVAVVDTAVANHLIKITKATRLMGCECTISGVSPSIAETVVELGIDVGNVSTTASLQDALVFAFAKTGAEIRRQP
jgi:rsbT co-antagonist protein RsbR